jgi:PIN domain nuclease of toxin-antitoxin system
MSVVHDASSLLALAFREPGADVVKANLRDSQISSVNWSEFIQKIEQRGGNTIPLANILETLGLSIVPFATSTAELAASLYSQTKPFGLSLGDRACLALALETQREVYTADKTWASLQLAIPVRVIR